MKHVYTEKDIESEVLTEYYEDFSSIVELISSSHGPQYVVSFISDLLLAEVYNLAPTSETFKTNIENVLTELKKRSEYIVEFIAEHEGSVN